MQEKKLFGFAPIEGALLLTLGFCILILPKLTSLSFLVMTSAALIVYGTYKIISSIIARNYTGHFICLFLLGLHLVTVGILLLFVPKVNLLWLIALIAVYFILETTLSTGILAQVKENYNFWQCKLFSVIVMFLTGLFFLIRLPEISFVTVAVLTGVCFILKGKSKLVLKIAQKEECCLLKRTDDNIIQ